MIFGSVGWTIVAAGWREWGLVALNGTFTITNLIGIWRWMS